VTAERDPKQTISASLRRQTTRHSGCTPSLAISFPARTAIQWGWSNWRGLDPECSDAAVVFECYPVGLQAQGYAYRVLTFTPAGEDAPELQVVAVRRDLKPRVRDLTLDRALPEIRNTCRTLARGVRMEFHFDEAHDRLLGPHLVVQPDVPLSRRRPLSA
jgi:hypothetical protein